MKDVAWTAADDGTLTLGMGLKHMTQHFDNHSYDKLERQRSL